MNSMTYKERFIDFMLDAGVLTFGDFITKSGRRSPYFINAGNYKLGSQMSMLGEYYAECLQQSGEEMDFLYGPAYKGIPLCVTTAVALYRNCKRDLPYTFNRKEIKDHGEGGLLVGYTPKPGDRAAIIEDVTSAGTSVREARSILSAYSDVGISSLFVSVDRMERGTAGTSALEELSRDYGIRVYPIVTIREIIAYLREDPAGKARVTTSELDRIDRYLEEYGV